MKPDARDFLFTSSLRQFSTLPGERIETIDMHTAGEPTRIILHAPSLPDGTDILARRRDAQSTWERYRRLLMFEPRGHQDMYGALLVPPASPQAHFGVLFLHNEGYSTMCGHAVIALGKAAVELGWVPSTEPVTVVRMDTPAGLVTAHVQVDAGRVRATRFENVPSYVVALDRTIDIPEVGPVRYDIAYGGAFYAFVDASSIGLDLSLHNGRAIAAAGMSIKNAVMTAVSLRHPDAADLCFLYGTIFTAPGMREGIYSRHVCVFADGAIDRSPTGTGVSARMALLDRREPLEANTRVQIESLTGGAFIGGIAHRLNFHGVQAVIPTVEGVASFTGRHTFIIEPDDPLGDGFLVR
jgi:trans-L-3-hydroxyproline dehydratase